VVVVVVVVVVVAAAVVVVAVVVVVVVVAAAVTCSSISCGLRAACTHGVGVLEGEGEEGYNKHSIAQHRRRTSSDWRSSAGSFRMCASSGLS
jgi:hypothetical protein